MPSITEIFLILEQYKYWVIFPISVIEGPIITVLGGFLVSLGVLGMLPAYIILVIGDVAGDIMFYGIGKYSRTFSWINRFTRFLGYTEEREKSLQNHFETHPYKTFLLAKFSQGIGSTVQIAGGMTGFSLRKFTWISFIGTVPKAFFLMTLGYYMGGSYTKIKEYLDSIALGVVSAVLVGIIFIFVYRWLKYYFEPRKSL